MVAYFGVKDLAQPTQTWGGAAGLETAGRSFAVHNQANVTTQGANVPVGYGLLRVGSRVAALRTLYRCKFSNCWWSRWNWINRSRGRILMKTIVRLHGILAQEYGEEFELYNINKPMDIISALEIRCPGIRKKIVNFISRVLCMN